MPSMAHAALPSRYGLQYVALVTWTPSQARRPSTTFAHNMRSAAMTVALPPRPTHCSLRRGAPGCAGSAGRCVDNKVHTVT